jgi:DNA-binding MarR family transcriptional regulator
MVKMLNRYDQVNAMATTGDLLAALRRFGLEDDRLDALAARHVGAPPVEFKAMDHLLEAGELTPGELSNRLALTSGAVTALVDRLERLGWVAREPHPSDRRSIVVRRTRAKTEAEQVYAPFAAVLERAAAKLTAAERDATVRFLDAAATAAREQADRLRARPGSGPAPTGSPAPGSPPTPGA